LTADGTPKISDFGLARRLEGGAGLTQSGVLVGTPSYMAPEQARGLTHSIGPAVDVYALGAILYELLTGRPPFRGETAAATVHQVITQDPVPPSRLNFQVPRDLGTICLKCLQKDPARRYATAAALADDLRRFGYELQDELGRVCAEADGGIVPGREREGACVGEDEGRLGCVPAGEVAAKAMPREVLAHLQGGRPLARGSE
jgi:serine/threonine protein kinase